MLAEIKGLNEECGVFGSAVQPDRSSRIIDRDQRPDHSLNRKKIKQRGGEPIE